MKRVCFSLLILLLCFSSCTIQKRTFRSGYHIEWKHKFRHAAPKEQGNEAFREEPAKESVIELSESPASDSFIASDKRVVALLISKPAERLRIEKNSLPNHSDFPPDTAKVEQQVVVMSAPELAEYSGHRKIVPLSWAALGMSLVYIMLLTLIVQGILSPSFIALCVVVFALTLVLAIISINTYRHNKAFYRRPQLAVLAIVLVGGSTVFIVVAWFLYAIGQAFNAAVGGFLSALFGGMN